MNAMAGGPATQNMVQHVEHHDEGMAHDLIHTVGGWVGYPIIVISVILFFATKGKRWVKTWWKRD